MPIVEIDFDDFYSNEVLVVTSSPVDTAPAFDNLESFYNNEVDENNLDTTISVLKEFDFLGNDNGFIHDAIATVETIEYDDYYTITVKEDTTTRKNNAETSILLNLDFPIQRSTIIPMTENDVDVYDGYSIDSDNEKETLFDEITTRIPTIEEEFGFKAIE